MLGLHLERISDIALTAPEKIIAERENAPLNQRPLPHHAPLSLQTKDLSYRFSLNEPPVFSGLNLHAEAGEFIAISGASGIGKTTLLKCLMGLLKAEGEIRIGGEYISRLPHYRNHIAAVTQDDQLLSGSIADNICCFDEQPDPDQLLKSSVLACIHSDIMKLPMQYNTQIGEMGGTLSGGQQQRIMLARALYRQPRILFLDEATSHLDLETERRINRNIRQLKMTRVVVAHRPHTLALADTVFQLQPEGCLPVSRNGA